MRIYYYVEDGNIWADVEDEIDQHRCLGHTVENLIKNLTALLVEKGTLDGLFSSSLDFGEEYGLPGASDLFDQAIVKLENLRHDWSLDVIRHLKSLRQEDPDIEFDDRATVTLVDGKAWVQALVCAGKFDDWIDRVEVS